MATDETRPEYELSERDSREPVAVLLGLGRQTPPDPAPRSDVTPLDGASPAAGLPLDRAVEAILMVADEPQSLVSLASALDRPVAVVRQAIARLVDDYDGVGGGVRRGFELREVGGGWRVYSRAEFDTAVRDFVITQNPSRLSQAALETLAVIAYRQPISRGQIAAIRAVSVDGVVRTLLARGLIAEVYTDSETGAIHYGTTELTLVQLGINSLDELPPISPLLQGADGIAEETSNVR
ncbi:SMC-Scp complex subunit ScpB [Amnibacterium flavum]|uniref:SMC-Scp complex subunit ScpB n=1 Tax=Amnibacterium flavum TaxID=2173173 RepID=A0A2V1HUX3_9MICO|nr:SMC-Scp complex subunit ScpB [Amnibacterium flavum]PVZ94819.1 SMC-Scp complex subunit ScpB [Amnibacterium flavum]